MATSLRFSEDDLVVKKAPVPARRLVTHAINLAVFGSAALLLAIGLLAA